MLGNDIVDLDDAETAVGAQHPRFDARVFGPLERDAIARAKDERRLRWATWAAKEAAFKAARRLDAATSFSPLRFEVTWLSPARASVAHAARRFEVEVEDLPGALHAIGRREGESTGDVLSGAGLVSALAPASRESQAPSDAARQLARARLATWLGVEARRITVTHDGRLPGLRLDGEVVDASLSFSHHGRYAAFACRLRGGHLAR
jgi:phosphopantetheine--protein transferase-like protein